jgi:hypothetical protein
MLAVTMPRATPAIARDEEAEQRNAIRNAIMRK